MTYSLKAILVFLIFGTLTAHAESMVKAPVFTDYGPVFRINDLTTPVTKDFKYKLLYDISEAAESEDQLNKNIESVARFINMHVMHGTKIEDIEIAVVLHGKATRDSLSHQAYEDKYLLENPTLDLIEKLSAKGVKFYQCGQSAYYQKISAKDLSPEVSMSLSAMTMLAELQADGYQIIPWW